MHGLKTFPESYLESNFFELLKNLFENYYDNLVNNFLFDEYNNLVFKVNIPVFKNWLMKNFINSLEALIFDGQRKNDIIQNEIEKLKLLNEPSENFIGSKVSKTNSGRKFLSKSERLELFNKFIYALFISLSWILDEKKDQKSYIDKFHEIGKVNLNSSSFLMKEELLNFSKNFVSIGKDLLDYIYNPQNN